eukprot:812791_1
MYITPKIGANAMSANRIGSPPNKPTSTRLIIIFELCCKSVSLSFKPLVLPSLDANALGHIAYLMTAETSIATGAEISNSNIEARKAHCIYGRAIISSRLYFRLLSSI